MTSPFKDKIILVTGGTGSIGSQLVEQLLTHEPSQVRVFSRDEGRQYELLERLKYPKNARLLIGDIRDRERVEYAFRNVDIVLHAAAMKHVPLCEYNPFEAVKTNIIGSQNVIDAALKNNVERVIAISTDKAVLPTNVMGTSKLMMEKLFINANWTSGKSNTKFSCVRFGNVAWARGSVLPLWKKQAETGGAIRVTNNRMTRFLMSLPQAANLVLRAAELTQVGEIFVLKMPAIAVEDLAKLFLEKYFPNQHIAIETVGNRAGEKMHEELMDENDLSGRVFENADMYILIPNLSIYNFAEETGEYPGFTPARNAARLCSKDAINPEIIKTIL